MSDNNEIEPDIEVVPLMFTPNNQEEMDALIEEYGDKLTAIRLAMHIMDISRPSFVVIGSPYLNSSERGFLIPSEIGISLNDNIGVTKSVAATILREIANGLDEDINKITNFVREATGQNDD